MQQLARGRRQLGDYLLEREIGRGGMGVVWLATQQSLHRQVALKVLPNFASLDPAAVARFRREADAAGRLSHPGIVPIHGVGEADGVHFYAMELIDGPPLSQWIDHLAMRSVLQLRGALVEEVQLGDRYPGLRELGGGGAGNRYVRSCAALCADVADALAVAHRGGVIHRDLKPSNILIHPAGRPVLVDFGLARDERAVELTLSGDQIGTPAYMAPEQASGRRRVDARVDVYGLGAVLYELLTLRPPYEGGTAAELVHRILTEPPPPLRQRNGNVPLDLAAVVHRAMAKEPDQRYPAIEALAADLRAFLAGRPVTARLPSRLQRARARLQRCRRTLLVTAGSAAAALAVAFVAGIVDDRGDVRHGEALLQEARQLLVVDGEPEQARNLYERALALTKQPALVRAQRQQDFRDAFARHYPGQRALLRRFGATLDEGDRAALQPLLDQLDGRGRLRFASRAAELDTARLSVRLLPGDAEGRPLADLPADWQPIAAGALLPVGECLWRAERKDGAVATGWARVVADQEVEIQPHWFQGVPDGAVAVEDPRRGDGFAVDRCEVTRAQYRAWLDGIADPQLRAELLPLGWQDDAGREADAELPVRGLSFAQARAFAAAHGAHLPSNREHWLAATGGLHGLDWPWGRRFDAARLAADPFRLSRPEPVGARAGGASPLSVLHLLGNVAEIQSPLGSGALAMGGGHFVDEPRSLQLRDEAVATAPLGSAFAANAYAGLRLYRFLPGADDAGGAERARQRREELRARFPDCALHDWRVEADGRVEWQLEQNGVLAAGAGELRLELATPGFAVRRSEVLDGHGQPLPARIEVGADGESALARAPLPAQLRPGQGYRLLLRAELEPFGGLLPEHDCWRLRLPLQRGRQQPAVHTLTLPPGAQLVAAAPLPQTGWQDGRQLLCWDQTGASPDETAVVCFRRDGWLSRRWPARAQVEALLAALLPAWNERTPALPALLDESFRQQPFGRLAREVLAGGQRDRLQNARLCDFACAAGIGTVEVVADWQFDGVLLPGWHLLLQWRLDGAPRLLRMQPRAEADQGSCSGGGYRHPGLRVRLEPLPDTALARTQDQLVALQLALRCERQPQLSAFLLGHFADPAEGAASIRFRLSAGDELLRPGELLGEREAGGWQVQDRVLRDGNGCAREQWRWLAAGRRHLLLRLRASGGDAEAAAAAFAAPAAQAWFAAVAAAVHLD